MPRTSSSRRNGKKKGSGSTLATKRPPQPQPQQGGENGDTLTAADEKALDTAWAAITDEEMDAWVKQTLREQQEQKQEE